MVSWADDGTLLGYDPSIEQATNDLFLFASAGSVALEGETRLGYPLDLTYYPESVYPNRLLATAEITVTSGDITTSSIGGSRRFGVTMYYAPQSSFGTDPDFIPSPALIRNASLANGSAIRSTVTFVTAGTRVFTINGPRPQQGRKYWVLLLPTIVQSGTPATSDIPFVGTDTNTLGRAISIWTNRTPTTPVITAPPTGSVITPGDDFFLSYLPSDPDFTTPDDTDHYNMDLAGVEFQYSAQPTAENPDPDWLPLEFYPASGSSTPQSWSIKGTSLTDDFADDGNYFLRGDLGGTVLCGVDETEAGVTPKTAYLQSGNWQIRVRTFDFGHPYPHIARPTGTGEDVPGRTPSTFPAINTSPWSEAVRITVPAQVPPPVAISPKDNIAVAFGETVRLFWQYRNTYLPPFPQESRTVQIREVGAADWSTVFSGVSGNHYVDLPPTLAAAPQDEYEYLTNLGFEIDALSGWEADEMYWAPPSVPPTLTNTLDAPNAHGGSRYIRLQGVAGGISVAQKRITLRDEDTSFQFTGWIEPPDDSDYVAVKLFWVDANGDRFSEFLGNVGEWARFKSTGDSWGGYLFAETGLSDEDTPGPVNRLATAVAVDVVIMAYSPDLDTAVDVRIDDVSFKGWTTALDAFSLDVHTRYEWRVQVSDSDPSIEHPGGVLSNYSTPARFWIVPVPASGPERPITSENIEGATLGCGTHTVEIYRRGGTERVGVLSGVSFVDWERKRDEISTSKVVVSSWDIDCGNLLSQLQTWAYEVVIWRDNGFSNDRVWEGPITLLTYEKDSVTIHAKDVMGYIYRRIMKQQMTDSYAAGLSVVDRARRIVQNALAPDDPNVLAYLRLIENTDDAKQSRSTPAYSRTAYEEIDDMAANAGLDYTVVGRSILLWGTKYRIGTLPEFKDEDLGAVPIVSEYGMSMANRYAVSDGNGIWGEATRLDEDEADPVYGLVEMLSSTWASDSGEETGTYTQQDIANLRQTFAEFAERSISDRYGPPVVVRLPENTTLNPSAVISIQHLVPGVVIPLRSNGTLRQVVGNQKLDSLKAVETGGKETITVTMSSFNRENITAESEV